MTDSTLPDILFYFSDQHHGLLGGYGGHPMVRTPNLDRLAAAGTVCETAYTACPLCVPARGSLLTGQLPSHNSVYNNAHMIASDQATFLHSLAALGYETVLVGRMHFKGPDQRHGFTRRVMGDITSMYFGGISRSEFGSTFGMGGCVDLVAAGDSPVLAYDRAAAGAAVEYLRQDHEKPQCIVVGTYGPHFPYVAPPDCLELYKGKVEAPASWDPEGRDPNPVVDGKRQRTRHALPAGKEEPVTTDVMLAARAAYFGMITQQDRHVGAVREQWEDHLARSGRRGVFIYSSDHGDTCGEHGVFGKQTFYEGSVRIPLIFEGEGVQAGARLAGPVSIMDIGPTLCDLTGATAPPCQDGRSLLRDLQSGREQPERAVLSEWVQYVGDEVVAARMIRRGKWKLTHYEHESVPDQLFDIESDPDELNNRAAGCPDVLGELTAQLRTGWDPKSVAADFEEKGYHIALQNKFNRAARPAESETEVWTIPESSSRLPEVII